MNMIMSRGSTHHHQPHRLPPHQKLTPTSPLDFTDKIPFKELELLPGFLGRGSYGTVFKGRWRGRTVAVKQFKEREEINSFLIEVKQLSCVKHPNIVTLYGSSTASDTAYLIMEYAEGGSLNHLLHECKQQQYDLRHACSWAMQTAKGVAYLHGLRPKPIMHRDLKPANLLLFSRGKILKICDFGTACAVKTQMTNNTGSASYMAPEVFQTINYSESADVFSWSIIFWEILARRHPYPQHSQPYHILWGVNVQNLRPSQLESCPDLIWGLITKCWVKPPEDRPTMQQVAEQMEFIFSLTDNGRRHSQTNHQNEEPIEHQASPDPKSPQMRQFCRLLPTISPFNACYTTTTATNSTTQMSQQKRVELVKSNMEFNSTTSSSTSSSNRNQLQQTTSSIASFDQEKSSHHHHHFYQEQQQHYQDQSHHYPMHVASLRSFNGPGGQSSGASTNSDRHRIQGKLSRKRARGIYLETLRREAEQLEVNEQRRTTASALKEFEELKKQSEMRRREIDMRIRAESNHQGFTTTSSSQLVVFKSPLPKSPLPKSPQPPPQHTAAATTCTSPDDNRMT